MGASSEELPRFDLDLEGGGDGRVAPSLEAGKVTTLQRRFDPASASRARRAPHARNVTDPSEIVRTKLRPRAEAPAPQSEPPPDPSEVAVTTLHPRFRAAHAARGTPRGHRVFNLDRALMTESVVASLWGAKVDPPIELDVDDFITEQQPMPLVLPRRPAELIEEHAPEPPLENTLTVPPASESTPSTPPQTISGLRERAAEVAAGLQIRRTQRAARAYVPPSPWTVTPRNAPVLASAEAPPLPAEPVIERRRSFRLVWAALLIATIAGTACAVLAMPEPMFQTARARVIELFERLR